jgi:hypothetical protein
MKYHVIGPSPLEKGIWLVYLPHANSLIEVDEDTGERLWECEYFNKCEDINYIIKELDTFKPGDVVSIPQSPGPTDLYIMVSGMCNLSCTYCFANRGSYGVEKYSRLIEEKVIERLPELLSAFPRPYHQLFDDCPASYSIYSQFSDLYQHIFDNLLVTFYVINQTERLSQVYNNIKRLHPAGSFIQIIQ